MHSDQTLGYLVIACERAPLVSSQSITHTQLTGSLQKWSTHPLHPPEVKTVSSVSTFGVVSTAALRRKLTSAILRAVESHSESSQSRILPIVVNTLFDKAMFGC